FTWRRATPPTIAVGGSKAPGRPSGEREYRAGYETGRLRVSRRFKPFERITVSPHRNVVSCTANDDSLHDQHNVSSVARERPIRQSHCDALADFQHAVDTVHEQPPAANIDRFAWKVSLAGSDLAR